MSCGRCGVVWDLDGRDLLAAALILKLHREDSCHPRPK